MKDKDIKKALECCFTNDWNRTKCDKCAFYTGTTLCVEDLKSASINLINRKKAEIERLRKEVNLVSIQFQDLQERYEEEQAEIERLKAKLKDEEAKNEIAASVIERQDKEIEQLDEDRNAYQNLYCQMVEDLETAKSEAIKEFAERLKNDLFYKCGDLNYTETCDTRRLIDKLVEEMVGENNA